jgi:hypothetical protein
LININNNQVDIYNFGGKIMKKTAILVITLVIISSVGFANNIDIISYKKIQERSNTSHDLGANLK